MAVDPYAPISADILARLAERWPEDKIAPSLERIAALCDLLGQPQRACPVVHVTGTNGKSSTARMIESLLRAAGLRTGLFTSPHLITARERICLNGQPITAQRLVDTWTDIATYVDLIDDRSVAAGGTVLSFFEVMTALAFACFADAPVDVVVLEVGMGGAWDATNVADGTVAVITPIGVDHVEYLGDDVQSISTEKAGIIKDHARVVLAAQDHLAAEVLLDRCVQATATIARQGVEFGVTHRALAMGGQVISLFGSGHQFDDVFLPLYGPHMADNAAVALAAVQALLGPDRVSNDMVREGFEQVRSPGRLEVLRRNPTIVVDAAHNPHGAQALAAAVAESFEFSSLIGVLGILADKDAEGMLRALDPVLDAVVITQPDSARALPAADLAQLAMAVLGEDRVHVADGLAEAIDVAVSLAESASEYGGAGVLVCGSVVLAAQAITLVSRG